MNDEDYSLDGMPKRILFTNITPLPPEVTREVAVAMVHNHNEMIELNPLVIEHHPIKTPRDAPAEEFLDCCWQQLTDKVHYLPGGLVKGKVSYKACFHDLPLGLQTHIYAPTGLDIREKWSIGGSLPGEPPEPRELGIDVPTQGLYLREECDMRCNRFLAGFVRKNLDSAHKTLVERVLKKAQRIEQHRETVSHLSYSANTSTPSQPPNFQAGSHMARSTIPMSPTLERQPQMPNGPSLADHPAFRNHRYNQSWSSAQSHGTKSMAAHMVQNGRQSYSGFTQTASGAQIPQTKQFIAELPGDSQHPAAPSDDNRQSMASELIGSDGNATSRSSGRGSTISSENQRGYPYNPAQYAGVNGGDLNSKRSHRVSELPTGAEQHFR